MKSLIRKVMRGLRLEKSYERAKLLLFDSTLPLQILLQWKVYAFVCSAFYYLKGKRKKDDRLEKTGFTVLGRIKFAENELGLKDASEYIDKIFNENPDNKKYLELSRQNHPPLENFIVRFLDHFSDSIRSILGSEFQTYWVCAYRTIAGGINAPDSSFAWHYDEYPPKIFKIFIYLGDTNDSNGAFRTFDRQASREFFRRGFISNSQEKRIKSQSLITQDSLKRVHIIEGNAGTAFIFDNKLVHRGTYPLEGQRTVICIEVFPSIRKFQHANACKGVSMPMIGDFPNKPWLNPYASSA